VWGFTAAYRHHAELGGWGTSCPPEIRDFAGPAKLRADRRWESTGCARLAGVSRDKAVGPGSHMSWVDVFVVCSPSGRAFRLAARMAVALLLVRGVPRRAIIGVKGPIVRSQVDHGRRVVVSHRRP